MGKKEEIIFKTLQKVCIAKTVLKIFDIRKLIKIKINISDLVIRVYFTQEYKGKWYLIIYLLEKLLVAKQNYNIYDDKLLAIIASLEI